MPQKTLFDGWTIHRMRIDVELNTNRPGGRIAVHFEDENGKAAGGQSIQWHKDRDLADLGLVLRDIANAFMWAPHLEMAQEPKLAFRRHCPEVPSGG